MKKLIIPVLILAVMFIGLYGVCQAQESSGQMQEPAMKAEQPTGQMQEPAMKSEQPTGEMQEPAMQEQMAPELTVSVAAICKDVVDREPVDSGNSFTVDVGKLYCFTQIMGAESPTHVTHVWYFDGTERARVELAVNAASWRTFSSKIIQAHELGAWRVDVLDADGKVLKSLDFEVTP
ncbi:MAG: DUF2914 domain-containing protein [Deltaproteobacteria bacterium]|nr:DUF2914 domain-containing protein [Deltaproteobacteria bacterium]